jgi:hypothetical protein
MKVSYFFPTKIDIKLEDALGRLWQGPTTQVDFNLPQRFNVTYAGDDSKEHHVAMVHRTVLGSMERFLASLIEHYGGAVVGHDPGHVGRKTESADVIHDRGACGQCLPRNARFVRVNREWHRKRTGDTLDDRQDPAKFLFLGERFGAGPGGLTAAMLLSSHGFEVDIFEKHSRIGGRNGEFRLGEFSFDIGPTFLMMKFIIEEMFQHAGRRLKRIF